MVEDSRKFLNSSISVRASQKNLLVNFQILCVSNVFLILVSGMFRMGVWRETRRWVCPVSLFALINGIVKRNIAFQNVFYLKHNIYGFSIIPPSCFYTFEKTSLKSLRLQKLLHQSVLALLSLTVPYLALQGFTGPYWALLSLTGPYWALRGLTWP